MSSFNRFLPKLPDNFGDKDKKKLQEMLLNNKNIEIKFEDAVKNLYSSTRIKELCAATYPLLDNDGLETGDEDNRFMVRIGSTKSFNKLEPNTICFEKGEDFSKCLGKHYKNLFINTNDQRRSIQKVINDPKVIHIVMLARRNVHDTGKGKRKKEMKVARDIIISAISCLINDFSSFILYLGTINNTKFDKDFGADENDNNEYLEFSKNYGIGTVMLIFVQQISLVVYGQTGIIMQVFNHRKNGPIGFYEKLYFKKLSVKNSIVSEIERNCSDHVLPDKGLIWMQSRDHLSHLLPWWAYEIEDPDVFKLFTSLGCRYFLESNQTIFENESKAKFLETESRLQRSFSPKQIDADFWEKTTILYNDTDKNPNPENPRVYASLDTLENVVNDGQEQENLIKCHDLGVGKGDHNVSCAFIVMAKLLFNDPKRYIEIRSFFSYIYKCWSSFHENHFFYDLKLTSEDVIRFGDNGISLIGGYIREMLDRIFANVFSMEEILKHIDLDIDPLLKDEKLDERVAECFKMAIWDFAPPKICQQVLKFMSFAIRKFKFEGTSFEFGLLNAALNVRFAVLEAYSTVHKKDAREGRRLWQARIQKDAFDGPPFAIPHESKKEMMVCLARINEDHFVCVEPEERIRRDLYAKISKNFQKDFNLYISERSGKLLPLEGGMYNGVTYGKIQSFEDFNRLGKDCKQFFMPMVRILDPLEVLVKHNCQAIKVDQFEDFLVLREKSWVGSTLLKTFVKTLNKVEKGLVKMRPVKDSYFYIDSLDISQWKNDRKRMEEKAKMLSTFAKIFAIIHHEDHYFVVEADVTFAKTNHVWNVKIADSLYDVNPDHQTQINQTAFVDVLQLIEDTKVTNFVLADNVTKQKNNYDCGVECARRLYSYCYLGITLSPEKSDESFGYCRIFRLKILLLILKSAEYISRYIAPFNNLTTEEIEKFRDDVEIDVIQGNKSESIMKEKISDDVQVVDFTQENPSGALRQEEPISDLSLIQSNLKAEDSNANNSKNEKEEAFEVISAAEAISQEPTVIKNVSENDEASSASGSTLLIDPDNSPNQLQEKELGQEPSFITDIGPIDNDDESTNSSYILARAQEELLQVPTQLPPSKKRIRINQRAVKMSMQSEDKSSIDNLEKPSKKRRVRIHTPRFPTKKELDKMLYETPKAKNRTSSTKQLIKDAKQNSEMPGHLTDFTKMLMNQLGTWHEAKPINDSFYDSLPQERLEYYDVELPSMYVPDEKKRKDWTQHYFDKSQQNTRAAKNAISRMVKNDMEKEKKLLSKYVKEQKKVGTELKKTPKNRKLILKQKQLNDQIVDTQTRIEMLKVDLKTKHILHVYDSILAVRVSGDIKQPNSLKYYVVTRDEKTNEPMEKVVLHEWMKENLKQSFINEVLQHHVEKGWIAFDGNINYLVPRNVDIVEYCKRQPVQPIYVYKQSQHDQKIRFARASVKFSEIKTNKMTRHEKKTYNIDSIKWAVQTETYFETLQSTTDKKKKRYVDVERFLFQDAVRNENETKYLEDIYNWFCSEIESKQIVSTRFIDEEDKKASGSDYKYGSLSHENIFYFDLRNENFFLNLETKQISALKYNPEDNSYFGREQDPITKQEKHVKVSEDWIKENFHDSFLEKLQEKARIEYLMVPIGNLRDTSHEPTYPLNPPLRYKQIDNKSCAFNSLASAFHYLKFTQEAQALYLYRQLFLDFLYDEFCSSIPQRIIKFIQSDNEFLDFRKIYGIRKLNDRFDLLNNPFCSNDIILFVILWGKDGSTNHAVTVVDKFIFDSNNDNAKPLSQESLNHCCQSIFITIKFGYMIATHNFFHYIYDNM